MSSQSVNDVCYQDKYVDIALDKSQPSEEPFPGLVTNVHIIYSLLKHTDLNENSDDDEFLEYSTSITKRKINVYYDSSSDQIEITTDNCNYLKNLDYSSSNGRLHFANNRLAVTNDAQGIIVFEENQSGDELNQLFAFNLSGGNPQAVYVMEDAVIGGFSDDEGCYMALLESNSNNVSNYISFAEGYSVKAIDYSDGLIALATGNDGVQIYEFSGGNIVSPYGSISSGYAYDVKIKNNLVFVATRNGLEIYKIGI